MSDTNFTTKITTTDKTENGYIKNVYNPVEAFLAGTIPEDAFTVTSEVASLMITEKLTLKEAKEKLGNK